MQPGGHNLMEAQQNRRTQQWISAVGQELRTWVRRRLILADFIFSQNWAGIAVSLRSQPNTQYVAAELIQATLPFLSNPLFSLICEHCLVVRLFPIQQKEMAENTSKDKTFQLEKCWRTLSFFRLRVMQRQQMTISFRHSFEKHLSSEELLANSMSQREYLWAFEALLGRVELQFFFFFLVWLEENEQEAFDA